MGTGSAALSNNSSGCLQRCPALGPPAPHSPPRCTASRDTVHAAPGPARKVQRALWRPSQSHHIGTRAAKPDSMILFCRKGSRLFWSLKFTFKHTSSTLESAPSTGEVHTVGAKHRLVSGIGTGIVQPPTWLRRICHQLLLPSWETNCLVRTPSTR